MAGNVLTAGPAFSLPIKRLDETVRFDDRDPINDKLNQMLTLIEMRLAAMEQLKYLLDQTVDSLTAVALQRLDETFTPLITELTDRLTRFGASFSAHSSTSLTVGLGTKTLYLDEPDRPGYVLADYTSLRHTGGTEFMTCRITSYIRDLGQLVVECVELNGSGTFADWQLRITVPTDFTHAARTDNPHNVTAAQVGAYTVAQTDADIAAAIAAVRGPVAASLDTLDKIATAIGGSTTFIPNMSAELASKVRYDAQQFLSPAQQATVQANAGISAWDKTARNLLINPAMQVDQYNNGNAMSIGANGGYFPVDTFYFGNSTTATWQLQRVNSPTPGGSPNRVRATVAAIDPTMANNQQIDFRTHIEGFEFACMQWGTLNAKPLLLRIGARCPIFGDFYVYLQNNAGNRTYLKQWHVDGTDIDQDQVRFFLIPGDTIGTWDTTTNVGLRIGFCMGAGTDYTSGALPNMWLAAGQHAAAGVGIGTQSAGKIFEFFDWGVYDGTGYVTGQNPIFEVPDRSQARRRCKRYYEHSWGENMYFGAWNNDLHYWSLGTDGIGSIFITERVTFEVEKRVQPSISIFSGSSGSANYARDTNYGVDTETQPQAPSTKGFTMQPMTGRANACSLQCHWTAYARLA
jgi:hypothetical protein